jgi:nitroreductase
MKLIESLNWRYATKKFDNTKKVSNEDLEKLKEAVRLSASSFGLQTYKVLIIEDVDIKNKLGEVSYNQIHAKENSHLFVLCNYTKIDDSYIDEYVSLTAKTRGVEVEKLKGYGNFMKETIGRFPNESLQTWTAKQAYIALGNLLAAAGELQIDACPIEGFNAKQYNEILGLDKRNLNAAVIVPIGYRSSEDQSQHQAKVRKSNENLFETI